MILLDIPVVWCLDKGAGLKSNREPAGSRSAVADMVKLHVSEPGLGELNVRNMWDH